MTQSWTFTPHLSKYYYTVIEFIRFHEHAHSSFSISGWFPLVLRKGHYCLLGGCANPKHILFNCLFHPCLQFLSSQILPNKDSDQRARTYVPFIRTKWGAKLRFPPFFLFLFSKENLLFNLDVTKEGDVIIYDIKLVTKMSLHKWCFNWWC